MITIFDMTERPVFKGEILLCEDNVLKQREICEHFSKLGLKTVVADNGRTGVELVQSRMEKKEKQFDLIFLDIHMPVMGGLEAAAKISGFNTEIPIIVLTVNNMPYDTDKYRTIINDSICKPFTTQELCQCLLKYLKPEIVEKTNIDSRHELEMEFQNKLMHLFLKNNRNKYGEITKALEEDDIILAHRLVHTLKSNAGQIRKNELQSIAADIERQLKSGENRLPNGCLKKLETELKTVLNELETNCTANSEKTSEQEVQTQPLDSESVQLLIEKLEPMLKNGSPKCINYIASLHRIPGSEKLITQIEDFRFEQATDTLAGLKKQLNN